MVLLKLFADWHVCTPTLFRYLNREYVEAFFKDGSLRLSSFARFASHKDEQRLDVTEGTCTFVHRTKENGGQTMSAWARVGKNAYVLSTTMRHSEELMNAFNASSYIRINDSTQFGLAIAKQIPGLLRAFEGPCLYQNNKIIERDLGYIDIAQIREGGLGQVVLPHLQHYPQFLKHSRYAQQTEYRFVWEVSEASDFIDIKAPEAQAFCTCPTELAA